MALGLLQLNKYTKVNMSDTVKIDKDLLKKVKKIIKDSSMKIKYSNAKQFVNIAVLEKLNEEIDKNRNGGKGK